MSPRRKKSPLTENHWHEHLSYIYNWARTDIVIRHRVTVVSRKRFQLPWSCWGLTALDILVAEWQPPGKQAGQWHWGPIHRRQPAWLPGCCQSNTWPQGCDIEANRILTVSLEQVNLIARINLETAMSTLILKIRSKQQLVFISWN